MQILGNGLIPHKTKAKLDHLQPKNGVSCVHMNTTVTALKAEVQKQKDQMINGYKETFVFGQYTKWLVAQAKRCKTIQDKKNYVEKIDSKSAHIQMLANI